jgi:predicted CoA-binding protein
MTTRVAVEAFLAEPAIAVVGVSRSGKKFGNYASKTLREKGYKVYPLHPSAQMIDGVECYRRFDELPEEVGAVLVVVPPTQAATVVREAAAAGIHRVWLQQGAESPDVVKLCADLGVEAVAGECILMFAKPASFHKAHGWVWKLLGKSPR